MLSTTAVKIAKSMYYQIRDKLRTYMTSTRDISLAQIKALKTLTVGHHSHGFLLISLALS
ncbi:hypothetical protein ACR71G_05710 [Xenorhabdus bovienii]|uniref:Uncharacterized protein n=1 Tax=Xenorhabdus bovienii str. kraussei Becker Underwood TaxID=1398204 RepID=A0A077PPV9_XENBV|nr:hypothetical protein XBKB1_1240039 [Xenorhabdus bovienii str. kraussei Becker Underwood]